MNSLINLLFNRNYPIIDSKGRFLGKYDLFLPLFLVFLAVLLFFIARVLLQKDTYVTAELFASGGEWWWSNPEPPHWITDPLQKGAIEYDPAGNPLVEVLDTQKFEVGDRKMLWMKVKMKVTPTDKAKQFRFRREPLQIGSLIYVAPNNIKIYCNVMWIEGISGQRNTGEKMVTLKEYDIFPWLTDQINVGDKMIDDEGNILAEILEKNDELAEMLTTDSFGRVHEEKNPQRRDLTLKVKMKTTVSEGRDYFSYFQPLKVGFYVWIPLKSTNISGNIVKVE